MSKKLIIDVGMHKGEDTEFYLNKGFNVVAIEANKELCDLVASRLESYIVSGQLQILNVAIVEKPGLKKFYVNDCVSEWGTMLESWVKRNEKMGTTSHEVVVEGITFRQVIEEFGIPYYLKIDIEGNDVLCLEALAGMKELPDYISIESAKTSWKELLYEFQIFKSLGFDAFKVVNQYNVPRQKSFSPPKEGCLYLNKFPFGSSGQFGEEAPGYWLPQSLALLKYRWVFLKYALVGNNGLFPNVHRKLPKSSKFKRIVHPLWYDTHAKRNKSQ